MPVFFTTSIHQRGTVKINAIRHLDHVTVFEYRNRFYLVDWKTNHLGFSPRDYQRERLQHTMQSHYYILQYHIYSLALHLFLRCHRPGYRYERDFGGVFYIFLRGVDVSRGSRYGIFYDLPSPNLIHALGKTLVPGYAPQGS